MKLLLIDDEYIIRNLVCRLLAPLRPVIEVVGEAADGVEGLKLFRRCKPDIIFVDIRMPEMDGLDFLAEVRKSDSAVPVVIISAYDEFEYAQKTLRYGAFDYLLKPIDEDELYRVLEKARRHLTETHHQKKQLVKMETKLRKLKDEMTGDSDHVADQSYQMDGKAAIARTLHYLDSYYAEDITQSKMAERVYLYPTYFSELFKKETGKGFNEYLNQLRIEKAKSLLSVKSLKLSEVAEMVGYHELGYFTRQFKRYSGILPSEYRVTQCKSLKKEVPMKMIAPEHLSPQEKFNFYDVPENTAHYLYGTRGGWYKAPQNPVLTDEYGVLFDVSVLAEEGVFKMWLSWRTHRCIAYSESANGLNWSAPVKVLCPVEGSDWEADELNRPSVIKQGGIYKMWYSGQMNPYMEDGHSNIGYAESADGLHWSRPNSRPVLSPGQAWERQAIMCPHVIFDEEIGIYKMWYSGGSNHEPDAIGYAESSDGLSWRKHEGPVLVNAPENLWEQHKVVACHVLRHKDWYYMFYIGHMHEERAQVGMARSEDGITGWQRHPENPLISPDKNSWDDLSVYKPYVLRVGDKWMMWYNGARFDPELWAIEQIGVAYLDGEDFGF